MRLVSADWVWVEASRPDRVVLYLHGGAYVMGSPRTHRGLAGRIARASRARVLLPDYRLAPEHLFPAAVDDACSCWRWLLARGSDPKRRAIAGVKVELEIEDGLTHVWQMFAGVPESVAAVDRIGAFIARHC